MHSLTNLLVTNAFAQAQGGGAPAPGSPSFSFFVPLVLVFVIFYFLMIRPQQKQQKLRLKMISEIKKGDAVVTTAGIHAKVVGTADRILTLEIADNVKIKVDRDAVARLDQPVGAVESSK